MLHLIQSALNPLLPLQQWVESWCDISKSLREPPRKREPQAENLKNAPFLS
jgi:hypothetical protein